MKVLVTGGVGFLGARIARLLVDRGHEVTVCSRQATKHEAPSTKHAFQNVDLRDAEAVSRAVAGHDVVFHVAAKAGVWGSRAEYFGINVTGTRNVIAACQKHGVRKLVYTSTPSVVFSGSLPGGANETAPYPDKFLTHYARTKAMAEREVLAASGLDRMQTCALRPHLIWGRGDPHLLPRVLERARAGRLKQVGDGRNRVDITHVNDAARAHLDALDHLDAAAGKAYFIASETVALWPWINGVLRRAGIAEVTAKVSAGTARRAGAVLELVWKLFRLGGEPPMTRFVAENLATDHWFDTSAARKDLGYAPQWAGEKALDEYFGVTTPAAKPGAAMATATT
ncbi:MAG: NAD-dependent epimerase/dehydratase family protein [Planctomycetes bacterium]|nr:NAD-dependent epimerase/dehydratase family protein [Planctomycetota bacterium]MCL4731980.1 NAD-dependent epimerase/dehydratase family protein [Planctomycetota bacterium]